MSDTSPISNLAVIDRLALLKNQFREILIPPAVAAELSVLAHSGACHRIENALSSGWLVRQSVSDQRIVGLLTPELHRGEAEAIALALELRPVAILLDEQDGRDAAARLGLSVTGVLGVLLRAKRNGHISSLRQEIDALRTEAGFYIARHLEQQILLQAGEPLP